MVEFKCPVCGNEVHKTAEFVEVKSELGFSIKAQVFQCVKDGKKFTVCPDCAGKMFIENENGFHDCPTCQGMGIIEIPENN